MKLAEKLNLNMEIAYVPVAKLKYVKQMMSDWKFNNRNIRIYSFITMVTSLISAIYFMYEEESAAAWISLASALFYLLSGICITTSIKLLYYVPILALVTYSLVPAYFPVGTIRAFFIITVLLPSVVCVFYCYKALLNYKNVYIPLSKRKGFPNFVFSTADMYGDKMYEKDKDEKSVAEKRVEASFNPFSEQSEKTDEEVARMNSMRYEEVKVGAQDIFKGPYYENKEVKHSADEEKVYKYGKKIMGFDFIIPHNEIEGGKKEDYRRIMWYWNTFKESMFRNEILWIFLFGAAIMAYAWTIGDLRGLLMYVFLAFHILGTNLVKKENPKGFLLVLCIYLNATIDMFVSPVVLALYTIIKIPGYIRWLCNMPIYRKLEKKPGFPSFLESTADVYGEQMYIIEKQEPLKKLPKLEPIRMDIGYDDDKKKDRGWNAFDYLDNDKENSAYDDFIYYEQAYEARRKAKPIEENQKPNKDMGRKTNNED